MLMLFVTIWKIIFYMLLCLLGLLELYKIVLYPCKVDNQRKDSQQGTVDVYIGLQGKRTSCPKELH